jgi:prolipoprotein diacylglyceryl transferase
MIYWDPSPEMFRLPYVDWPIFWYGGLFAVGFALGLPIFVHILTRFLGERHRKEAFRIADRLTAYMVIGTVVGARLGHFLFYEKPAVYLGRPLALFQVWEGGLASHGAAVGIVLALMLFSYKIRPQQPQLTPIRLLDFVCVPTALAACLIRFGNFMNQEVLGTPSTLPWAVHFGHPADPRAVVPCHPVQLYEALFYLLVFFFLFRVSRRRLHTEGTLIGLFLILVFTFRFFIEFLKLEQSRLVHASLTMGQMLSIPLILAGIVLLGKRKKV